MTDPRETVKAADRAFGDFLLFCEQMKATDEIQREQALAAVSTAAVLLAAGCRAAHDLDGGEAWLEPINPRNLYKAAQARARRRKA